VRWSAYGRRAGTILFECWTEMEPNNFCATGGCCRTSAMPVSNTIDRYIKSTDSSAWWSIWSREKAMDRPMGNEVLVSALCLLREYTIVNRIPWVTSYTCDMIVARTMRWEPHEELSAAADTPNRDRRMPEGEVKIGYWLCDDGAHANHGETANDEVATNGAAGSDRSALSYKRG